MARGGVSFWMFLRRKKLFFQVSGAPDLFLFGVFCRCSNVVALLADVKDALLMDSAGRITTWLTRPMRCATCCSLRNICGVSHSFVCVKGYLYAHLMSRPIVLICLTLLYTNVHSSLISQAAHTAKYTIKFADHSS